MEQQNLLNLKTKLQSLGALRPEAWEKIIILTKEVNLKPNQSFIRTEGTLAYVASGLLKEYDSHNRTSPSIVNFIANQQIIITRKHNQGHYLKAIIPTLVYYWDFEELQNLYREFNDLKIFYDSLCSNYDEQIHFRQLILEHHHANERIGLFISKYKSQLNQIKKKDMANYLMLYYDNFIRSYRKFIQKI